MDRTRTASLFRRQAGVISRDQALAAGLTRHELDRLCSSGEWVREHPEVYRLAAVPRTHESALRSAALWLMEATLIGWGAGWWWGFTPDPPPSWVFSVPGPSHLSRRPGVRVRRCFVDPYDRVRLRGVVVISKPLAVLRTAVDLERLRPGQGIALIDRAKQRRWVSPAGLEAAFRRNRRTWGTTAMRALLQRTGDLAHSELERLATRLLRAAGIVEFEPNYTVRLSGGRTVEIDLAFPALRVAVELDGWAYHNDPDEHQADLRRGNALIADGWTVLRFTHADLANDPAAFVRAVRDVLAMPAA